MSPTEIWAVAIVLILIAAVVGFIFGRKAASADPAQITALTAHYENRLTELQTEFDTYRQEAHRHHEKTASLFVAMATPYKEMFDHLSEGYEKLGHLGDQTVLPKRAGALLDGPAEETGATAFTATRLTPETAINNATLTGVEQYIRRSQAAAIDSVEPRAPKDYAE